MMAVLRVGEVWYWVDPTEPPDAIEPGDTVIIYTASGEPQLAVLDSAFSPGNNDTADATPIAFSTLESDRFALPVRDIVALHLAAVDEEQ
jgi:hypothetical protein